MNFLGKQECAWNVAGRVININAKQLSLAN